MAKDKKGKSLPKGIRQRSNGTFEGRFMYEYQNYAVYGTTITEVKKKMTELRYKLDHGLYIEQSKITLNDWFKTWMNEYKKNSVKIGTFLNYNNYYEDAGVKRVCKNTLTYHIVP